ncbi:hypothetical protein ES703_59365 [subsurface metagenome]
MIDLDYVGLGHPAERPFVNLIHANTVLVKAQIAFEIGSGAFTFSQAILAGMEQTAGMLYTCDPNPKIKYAHPRMAFSPIKSDEAAKTWDLPIDLLMIDGNHTYPQVKKDFNNFYPFVSPWGVIIFHDINVGSAPGVKKLWNEIKPHHQILAEILTWPGLGVIRK